MPDTTIKNGISATIKGFRKKLGIPDDDANYLDTPERIFRAYQEMIKSPEVIQAELDVIFQKSFPSKYRGHVIWPDIKTFSLCPHHWLTVEYEVTVAYLPAEVFKEEKPMISDVTSKTTDLPSFQIFSFPKVQTQVIGLSKPVRLARLLACQPCLQEDYTQNIADTLEERINPRGIAVITRGMHGCMKCRGVKTDKPVIMSVMEGSYMNDGRMRQELFELLKLYRR